MNLSDFLELKHPTAESSVLAGMMGDTDTAIKIAEELDSSDFSEERYAITFEAISRLLHGIEPIDNTSVLAECKRVAQERKSKLSFSDIHLNFPGDPARASSYARTVQRYGWLRNAGEFAQWLIQALEASPSPDDLYAEAQERLTMLRPITKASAFVYGQDTVQDYEKLLRKRAQDNRSPDSLRCSWPWKSWENMIRYLRPGMVGIIAAADGQGKTTYLEMIGEHWAMMGIPTVYVHLEDDLEYKKDRRMARFAQLPLHKIEDAETLLDFEWEKVREANQNIATFAGNLHYYHAPGRSMAEIVRELEARVSEEVCKAVVFDYLDKVQPTRAQIKAFGQDTWNRQADDMEQLKSFAERYKVPVMTATQGNKAMQDGNIQTRRNIQGSGQKSQKSQLVIILQRDLVTDDAGLKDGDGKVIAKKGDYSPLITVRVDKQNRGALGEFKQLLAGRFFTVRDLA